MLAVETLPSNLTGYSGHHFVLLCVLKLKNEIETKLYRTDFFRCSFLRLKRNSKLYLLLPENLALKVTSADKTYISNIINLFHEDSDRLINLKI